MSDPDIWSFLPLALFAAFNVGLSKGGLPVVAMLSVPMLAFVMDPLAAAAMLLPIYIVSDVFGVWIYRRDYSAVNLKILIPAGVLGVVIGTLVEPYVPVAGMNLAVGLIGILYCVRHWFFTPHNAEPKPARPLPGLFWGALAGITSFVSHAGAPPYQVYILPQKLPKLVFAGTSTILFAVINLSKLPAYLSLSLFPEMDVTAISALAVTALAGVWAGAKLTRILPERTFFVLVQAALFLLSASLVWKSLGAL